MSNMFRDVKIGLRVLRRTPGLTAVAIMTVAVGIASTTAIFSVVYATFFEPLPYPDPDRLVMVWARTESVRNRVSAGAFVEWKRQSQIFEDLNAWTTASMTLSGTERPEQVRAGRATPGLLSMWGYGYPLAHGRGFLEQEGTLGHDRVILLTHRFWRDRFGADPEIVGRVLRLDGQPHTVIGVLGPGSADRGDAALWVPLTFTQDQLNHRVRWLLVMGRMKPGVTLADANAHMTAVNQAVATADPAANVGWIASVEPLQANFLGEHIRRALWLLLAGVTFVLFIACANVANLLLTRGTARRREIAVRTALGASRAQIVRQLITESLLIALAGTALGVALARGLLDLFLARMPALLLPIEADVRFSIPVLLCGVGACMVSGILFGLAPAWQVAQARTQDGLKETGRSLSGGGRSLRFALVTVEVAIALTLLTASGVAIHSLVMLARLDLGFRPERLLTFSLPIPQSRFRDPREIDAFYKRLIEHLESVPGVLSASASTGMPVRGTSFGGPFTIVGTSVPEVGARPMASFNMVTPSYVTTFGIQMTRGRPVTGNDHAASPRVAMVNEAFVRQNLRDRDPLTQRIAVDQWIPGSMAAGAPVEWHVVGVYADVHNARLTHDVFPEITVPFAQSPWPHASVAVRTAGEPGLVRQSIASALRSIDPDVPMANVATMDRIISNAVAAQRFSTALLGAFAGVALLLAACGIYGVVSFTVAQRASEIGIRMALGASRTRVMARVVRDGMAPVSLGVVLGSVGAYIADRAVRTMVYGIADVDLTAFAIVILTLLAAALLACLIPAGRAASLDPLVALRQS
jgi:putative ABC transport system permease protein